ncbi:hypothetical protein FRB91_003336 [Serendipita sp. 411]|nr:hypothetical protein FRC18_003608 [Serendipita sp. 400]KAG8843471.1 hypothetical protein FRB91_003336 [Serendipita sp. 411]
MDLNAGSTVPSPSYVTGWEAPPRTSTLFTAPDNWMAGRIWDRRDCDFSRGSGPNACLTGSCTGTGLNCDKTTPTGVPAGRMDSTTTMLVW